MKWFHNIKSKLNTSLTYISLMNRNIHLPNYDILTLLGEGGMSKVYLAKHRILQQEVAVKVLNQEFIKNGNIKGRFLSEAKSLFVMSHINIVRVTDLIDQENMVAYIMEYIQGWSLKDYLENNGSLKDEDIQRMISQMLDALSYVHGQGLVHRDIKPANIFITRGGIVKLMDFGIAKRLGGALDYDATGIHQTMGTTMYMSPEQIKSTKDVTYLSDLYSLGVVLWQMVTGRKPYDNKTSSSHEIQSKIVNEKLPLTGTRWDDIIGKSTAKQETGRFRSANEFKEAVNQLYAPAHVPTPIDKVFFLDIKYYFKGIKNMGTFIGRTRRTEFFSFLFYGLMFIILALIIDVYYLITLCFFFHILPLPALIFRRLHDIGKSGWWILSFFVFWLPIILMLFFNSQPGTNKWGQNPKEIDSK
jgi:serine/threonine protein kinase